MVGPNGYLTEAFGDLRQSPYRDRLFVLLDKRQSVKKTNLRDRGIQSENIVELSKNGIEHYYPTALVARALKCDEHELKKANLEDDPIEFNGIRITKKQLAKFVSDQLTAESVLDPELRSLVDNIQKVCA